MRALRRAALAQGDGKNLRLSGFICHSARGAPRSEESAAVWEFGGRLKSLPYNGSIHAPEKQEFPLPGLEFVL